MVGRGRMESGVSGREKLFLHRTPRIKRGHSPLMGRLTALIVLTAITVAISSVIKEDKRV